MIRFIWLTVILGLTLVSWTASWADMEEVIATLTSGIPGNFGTGVINVGDVNGDGHEDLMVEVDPSSGPERMYIYFGGPSFDTIPDVNIPAPGLVQSRAGDVNGDGFCDVMALAHYPESVYLYYGGNPMDTLPDLKLYGKTEREFFGQTMCDAGDLNGDGYDDLLIGAYIAPNGGKAYVFFGGNPMDTIPDLILRTHSDCAFGLGLSGLGDVNGDGYPDVAVGDPWRGSCMGKVFVYFGGPDMDRIPDVILTGEMATGAFGYWITGGNLNGDRYSDIVVAAFMLGNGRIYVYYGGPVIEDIPDLTMASRVKWEELGTRVRAVGDLDGDGYDDIVSATNDYLGHLYAYYGRKWMDRHIDLVIPSFAGGYGRCFAGIDINADGHQELCVEHPTEERVYIFRIRHNQFVIALLPDARKVVKGEEVGFQATITNNTAKDLSLHFWVDLLDPTGVLYGDGPASGPRVKKIPAKRTVTEHISMAIPGDPPLGQYTCTLKADTTEPKFPYLDFIENDSFEFELVSGVRISDRPFLSIHKH